MPQKEARDKADKTYFFLSLCISLLSSVLYRIIFRSLSLLGHVDIFLFLCS
jgi:hypothetical protein